MTPRLLYDVANHRCGSFPVEPLTYVCAVAPLKLLVQCLWMPVWWTYFTSTTSWHSSPPHWPTPLPCDLRTTTRLDIRRLPAARILRLFTYRLLRLQTLKCAAGGAMLAFAARSCGQRFQVIRGFATNLRLILLPPRIRYRWTWYSPPARRLIHPTNVPEDGTHGCRACHFLDGMAFWTQTCARSSTVHAYFKTAPGGLALPFQRRGAAHAGCHHTHCPHHRTARACVPWAPLGLHADTFP